MSFDSWPGGFTDLEMAAGVPSLVHGGNVEHTTEHFLNQIKRSEAIRLLASIKEKPTMRELIHKKILVDDLDYMVRRYAKKENLPAQYLKLAEDTYCINILLKGFLKRVGNLPLDTQLIGEIEDLVNSIRENREMEIVYDRIGKVQSFIHNKVNSTSGFGAHMKLPVVHMRNLLSACRLHLNITEIRRHNGDYLMVILRKSARAADKETLAPSQQLKFPMRNYIPYWRVRHMKGLHHYAQPKTRDVLNKIMMVDDTLPLDEYRIGLIRVYSGDDFGYDINNHSEPLISRGL